MKTPYRPQLTPPVDRDDHTQGPADAPVTLVEYGDFECPHCGAAYPVVKEVERLAGDLVRVVFRNFPLFNNHPHAEQAAQAAEAAAAQGKFWEMHDLLFENQQRLGPADLETYAAQIGLDMARFRNELETERWATRVRESFRSGVLSGVNGTPTFFINGVRHDRGFELETLLGAVTDAAMSDAKTPGR